MEVGNWESQQVNKGPKLLFLRSDEMKDAVLAVLGYTVIST